MTKTTNATRTLAAFLLTMTILTPILIGMTANYSGHQGTVTPGSQQPGTSNAPPPPVTLKWFYPTSYYVESSPAIADVDGDGRIEVLVGYDSELDAVNGSNGEFLRYYDTSGGEGPSFGSPVIADMYGDGKLQVLIVGYGNLYSFNGTGELNWPLYHGSITGAAVGDVDGDGKPEIVMGTGASYGFFYCLNATGDTEWGYPYGLEGSGAPSSPTLADLDGDGKLEVFVVRSDGGSYFLCCLNGTANTSGYADSLWTYNLTETDPGSYSSPAVADIDNDGHMEVVIGSLDNKTYCLSDAGTSKWNYTTGGPIDSSPTLADIDGDGKLETLIGSDDNNVYCLDSTGKLKWSYQTGNWVESSPAVADIDGDKQLEVLIGSDDTNLYCLDRNGSMEWSYPTGGEIRSSPVVANVDGDNKLEVVFGSWDGNVSCLSVTSAPIVESAYLWPSVGYGEDIRHTGCAADSDGDGLTDNYEATAGSNPGSADTDGDTAADYQEFLVSTNPCIDTVAPATVANLTAIDSTATSITLSWTAPGNNGKSGNATGYWLKYSASGPITADNWDSATNYTQSWRPAKNGTVDTGVVTGLIAETRYWFALEAYDEVGNYGDVSTCTTGATADIVAPASITDLVAGSAGNTSITLAWTAPGDNGDNGNATGYWVKYSTSGPINAANWASATTHAQSPPWVPAKNGTTETRVVTGLTSHTRYWFAIKAFDETPNYGDVSNSPDIWTLITGWQSNETVTLISGAGNNATMPSGSFEQYGFTVTTNNATGVSVTFGSSKPSATGAPIPGLTSFLYLDISGTQTSGTTGAAVYLYYNRSLVQSLGIDELTMQIYRWNATTSNWYAIPGSHATILNSTHGVIVAYLDHFSYFAVFGSPSGTTGNPASFLIIVTAAGAALVVVAAVIAVRKRAAQAKVKVRKK